MDLQGGRGYGAAGVQSSSLSRDATRIRPISPIRDLLTPEGEAVMGRGGAGCRGLVEAHLAPDLESGAALARRRGEESGGRCWWA
jgi:hypothetical protein